MLLLLPLLAGGCTGESEESRLKIETVDLRWSNGLLTARLGQKLALSDKARNALQRGVPLTLQVELIFRDQSTQTRIAEQENFYRLSYLPLSNRYQLTLPGGREIRTFPRLRHLLAELGNLLIVLDVGALPDGDYEVLARTRIDQRRLPIAMRLPILFDADWKHNSSWSTWPLTVDSSA